MKKRTISILVILALVMSMSCQTFAYISSAPTTTAPWYGTITGAPSGLNVRSGAGSTYSVLTTLSNLSNVQIVGKSGDWYKVQYSTSGSTGFASTDYFTYDHNYAKVKNAPSGLVLRSQASTTGTQLALIPNGTYLSHGGWDSTWVWANVLWATTKGYVHSDYYDI